MSQRPATRGELTRALVRFNARILAATLGVLSASGLFLATLVLVLRGDEQPGTMLALLGHFFPGYAISVGGAFVGALWAGAAGYLLGSTIGRAYGPWVLRTTAHRSAAGGAEDPGVAVLEPLPAALTTGAVLAVGLIVATNWLWFRYGLESPHLGLLGHYLPGYTTDPAGSLIGAAWSFLYGSVAAGLVAWLYNRIVAFRFPHVA